MSRLPGGQCFKLCWPKYKWFKNLYEQGIQKLEQEMDIVKMVKDLRQLKILLKKEALQLEIQNDEQNLLKIDNTEEEKGLVISQEITQLEM